ncbi:kynureninase [Hazenella sp. IB182357]|uniref:Kynureninase n=1 Tax=Polycladospora coralii TaxID=2771432 RepID=A0A926NCY3_9BACL|nr:kynureninase [Polycladospora coralii]MBD1373085.1 kynureninase [Polycladospora coralii]MBS7529569.1 kynureninase [Polycladospora coralii]
MRTMKELALQMDQTDPLACYRDEFYIKEKLLYLNGNSLGLMSKRAESTVLEVLDSWKQYGIDGWTQGKREWYTLSEKLGRKMAELVGAKPNEVIVTGSTTVNIHQLIASFYQPQARRYKIITDTLNFPSDIYALQSQVKLHGYDPEDALIQIESHDGLLIEEADIIAAMEDDVALIFLPSVYYRSGQLIDVAGITREAHKRGIKVGIDACHSAGVIPHAFHDWHVDFAVWCTYKYLNSGPGGVAALFVHEQHHGLEPGLAGWFGSDKEKQFDMLHQFEPASDVGAFQIGTPHILSLAPLMGSLEHFSEVGITNLRKKSLSLTEYMMDLIEERLVGHGFKIVNPRDKARRGGHVCLEHPDAARICKALKANEVVPDYRSPNMIRLAPIPLYTSYFDVYDAISRLKQIMDDQVYLQYPNQRDVVA